MRVELAELRAQNAELRLTCQLLGERTEALRECDQRRAAENAALRERNRLLSEEVAELRRRVGQNPRNSHRPPSSEGYAKPAPRSRRERTDRQPGGQPGHPGATLGQVATPAERVRHRPEVCAGCVPRWPRHRWSPPMHRHGQSAFGVLRMLHAGNPWMPVTA